VLPGAALELGSMAGGSCACPLKITGPSHRIPPSQNN